MSGINLTLLGGTYAGGLVVDYLVVAGGGAGGGGQEGTGPSKDGSVIPTISRSVQLSGAGGGAGGVLAGSSLALTSGAYAVTVGAGGAAKPISGYNSPANRYYGVPATALLPGSNNGSDSQFGSPTLNLIAVGGGGGGITANGKNNGVSWPSNFNAKSGGSGGGGVSLTTHISGGSLSGGAGTPGQGNPGGSGGDFAPAPITPLSPNWRANKTAGSGGGAGAAGVSQPAYVPGNKLAFTMDPRYPTSSVAPSATREALQIGAFGGDGVSSSISGTATYYGGGGSSQQNGVPTVGFFAGPTWGGQGGGGSATFASNAPNLGLPSVSNGLGYVPYTTFGAGPPSTPAPSYTLFRIQATAPSSPIGPIPVSPTTIIPTLPYVTGDATPIVPKVSGWWPTVRSFAGSADNYVYFAYNQSMPGNANTGGGGGGGNAAISSYAPRAPSAIPTASMDTISTSGGTAGGSGVVIIRYLGAQVATGGTVTSSGGYTIHTFTSTGTFTVP